MKLKKLCAIVMSCALLITTGCSSTNTQSKDDSKKSDVQETTSASYPIKIKHAYGETIIESEPKNIATISWGNQDVPLALGITPVYLKQIMVRQKKMVYYHGQERNIMN